MLAQIRKDAEKAGKISHRADISEVKTKKQKTGGNKYTLGNLFLWVDVEQFPRNNNNSNNKQLIYFLFNWWKAWLVPGI